MGVAPAPPARIRFVVRGVVQGVGYRYYAWREASDLGLRGWVANEADGSVQGVAEGRPDDIEEFLDRLRAGPASAMVERVDVVRMPATGTLGPFGVRAGGHRGD